MLATQKQTAETTLRLFQNNSKRESCAPVFQFAESLKPKPILAKARKLLPKEQYACDVATD